MNKKILVPALLVCASALPLVARADTMDDFVLTGGGFDITFTLPASPPGNMMVCPPTSPSCVPGSQTAFYLDALVTTNGVSAEEGLAFPTSRFGAGMTVGTTHYYGNIQLFVPDAANPTFVPGTYELGTIGSNGDPIDYTLTITQENAPAPTPEPSTMALLGTGVLGLIGAVRNRRAVRRGL